MVEISNKTLTEEAYEAIKEMIFTNEVSPGEFLSIEKLSEELGVSQTPVREALIRLSNDGLVKYNPRRKAQVSDISSEDIRQTYEVRKILEPYVAANAAADTSEEKLQKLKERMEGIPDLSGEEKYQRYRKTDIELNSLLLEAVGNDLLLQLFDFIENYNIRIRFFAEATAENRNNLIEQGNQEHLSIIRALLDKSPQRAREAIVEHLQKAEKRTWEAFQGKTAN
ncbi:MAG: GntR family transcriptional regulator [Candidatus Bipolaricaulota bacterium]